jgi:hypothetical protein
MLPWSKPSWHAADMKAAPHTPPALATNLVARITRLDNDVQQARAEGSKKADVEKLYLRAADVAAGASLLAAQHGASNWGVNPDAFLSNAAGFLLDSAAATTHQVRRFNLELTHDMLVEAREKAIDFRDELAILS